MDCGHFKHFVSQSLNPNAVCKGAVDPIPAENGGFTQTENYEIYISPEEAAEMKQNMANQKAALLSPPADVQDQVDLIDANLAKFS